MIRRLAKDGLEFLPSRHPRSRATCRLSPAIDGPLPRTAHRQQEHAARDREVFFKMQQFVAEREVGVKQHGRRKAKQTERRRAAPRIAAYRDREASNELQGDDKSDCKCRDAQLGHSGRRRRVVYEQKHTLMNEYPR